MMSDLHHILVPKAPFADLPVKPTAGRGVIVSDRDGLGLATVLARKDKSAALVQFVREHFGIDLPTEPRRAAAGDIALVGTGPGAWLVTCEQGGNAFAVRLKEEMGDLASVSDQSDGYAVLRLTGSRVRETLCKIVPVDVHPRAFKIGDVAVTVAAYIGVTMWRLENQVDGAPVFEVALYRSLAMSLWQVLGESAAEFGLHVRPYEPPMARINGTHRQAWLVEAAAELGEF